MRKLKAWWKRKRDRTIQKIFLSLRKVSLPGLKGIGLYDVLKFFFDGLFDAKFTLLAAAMAFNFFFSLFPLLFIILFILPHLPGDAIELKDDLINFLTEWIPAAGQPVIQTIINSLKDVPFQLILLNMFLTLYGALRGIVAMMKAFTKDVDHEEIFKRRNFFQLYGIAFVLLIILSTLFAISICALVFGKSFIEFLRVENYLGQGFYIVLLNGLNYLITLFLLYFSISIIYYLAPPTKQRWAFFSPGTVVAGFLMLLTLVGLNYFFSSLTEFNRIYGSLGAVIIMMLWFYYISIILLIGFELNAAIDMANYYRKRNISFEGGKDKDKTVQTTDTQSPKDQQQPEATEKPKKRKRKKSTQNKEVAKRISW